MTYDLRPVTSEAEWEILAWLWQAFQHDMAPVVGGLPYGDGRYQHGWLDQHPRPDGHGYIAWRPHPNTGEPAPVAFATVLHRGGRWDMQAFWVAPAARRDGLGSAFARDVIACHPGAWEIAFQEANAGAAVFWRRIAGSVWGQSWVETTEAVPGRPDVPPDHWIRTL